MSTRFHWLAAVAIASLVVSGTLSTVAAARAPEPTTAPPAPYDPAIHGPASPDSTAYLNIAGRPGLPDLAADRAKAKRRLPTETPSKSQIGFFINTGYSINGVYAGHDVNTDVVVPCCSGPILYAPTLVPPDVNNSGRVGCLESVTIHWWGQFASEVAQGFWDHCIKKNWATLKKVDSTWLNKYTRMFDGELRYFTQVYLGSFGWEGYLYNFNNSVWEVQWTVNSAATPSYNNAGGWTAWESFNLDTTGCWDTKSIRAAPVQIRFTNGVWQNLTSPYGLVFDDRNSCTQAHHTFIVNQSQWDWQVNWHP